MHLDKKECEIRLSYRETDTHDSYPEEAERLITAARRLGQQMADKRHRNVPIYDHYGYMVGVVHPTGARECAGVAR